MVEWGALGLAILSLLHGGASEGQLAFPPALAVNALIRFGCTHLKTASSLFLLLPLALSLLLPLSLLLWLVSLLSLLAASLFDLVSLLVLSSSRALCLSTTLTIVDVVHSLTVSLLRFLARFYLPLSLRLSLLLLSSCSLDAWCARCDAYFWRALSLLLPSLSLCALRILSVLLFSAQDLILLAHSRLAPPAPPLTSWLSHGLAPRKAL